MVAEQTLPAQGDPEGVPSVGVSVIVARRGTLRGEGSLGSGMRPPSLSPPPGGCNLIPGDSPRKSPALTAGSFSFRSQGRVQGNSRLLHTHPLNPERPELTGLRRAEAAAMILGLALLWAAGLGGAVPSPPRLRLSFEGRCTWQAGGLSAGGRRGGHGRGSLGCVALCL